MISAFYYLNRFLAIVYYSWYQHKIERRLGAVVKGIWRILAPYLINIKESSTENAFSMIRNWLNKCNSNHPMVKNGISLPEVGNQQYEYIVSEDDTLWDVF